MQNEIATSLEKSLVLIKKRLQDELKAQGHELTGALSNSIRWEVAVEADRTTATMYALGSYWDRSVSYQNKRFLGAARDGYHDTQKLHAWGMGLIGGAITLPIVHNYQQQKKWQTVVDLGLMLLCSFTSYQVVSQAVYNAY